MTVQLSPTLHTLGNTDLLALRKIAFLCSRRSPESACRKALAWAATAGRAGGCIVSGCQSAVEKDLFRALATQCQPMIVVLARGLRQPPEAEFAGLLAAGRLLLMTRYAATVTHPCEEKCLQRNRLMMELSDEIVVGYAAPGGTLQRLCREFETRKELIYLTGREGEP
ncbi:DNA-processing protein DprA [Geomesophilobacter sediminis]|uniref:DNA-processing protein DprA n=1 Tax=Geomesophilobacter sediminis TaxID=2798584 RepID=A0A8J7J4V1_9BACT|nr:DNA-processing protein DprA [Geomesophilobacter sediminis]MBJ6723266.1 DNA-processing protein DprA [Geomesophilobacter sediminis]